MEEIEAWIRRKKKFALAFIDLDGLKQVNDTKGHLAGDGYLRRFADDLRKGMEKDEALIRYGGDEFVLLFCAEEEQQAGQRLQKLTEET